MTPDTASRRRLSVQSAAAYLGVSPSFLNKARCRGDGPPFAKIGRRVLYDAAVLDGWVEARGRLSTSNGKEG
jgi:hypothetical protein